MKSFLLAFILCAANAFAQAPREIDSSQIRRMATQNNGRVKPFDTLARESVLFLTGAYGRHQVNAVQTYLNLIVDENAANTPLIEVRDPQLRERLGALRSQRFFSVNELEASPLMKFAEPLLQKAQDNDKSLTEPERKLLETAQQLQLARMIISGDHLEQAIDFTFLKGHGNGGPSVNSALQSTLKSYLQALAANQQPEAKMLAGQLVELTRGQETPEIFQHYMTKLDTEIFYNDYRLFLWASLLSLAIGLALLMPPVNRRLNTAGVIALSAIPLAVTATALFLRVYITQFAPVTNMYTTMIWVSLGVALFNLLLFTLYRNRTVAGLLMIGSGLILQLTEQTPLVLSPDMDPIVAVLRSNYWLSTHVTTITISYAAFTIAMLLGNAALIRAVFGFDDRGFFKEYSHYAYRMVQLGCFLLTVGIILGGIWADYSWGRFWGWDPKETWALIADLGFLAILHARYAGWLTEFSLLAWCPVAYLLVIMAWYGVNFVLAAGLHSYGFSSGGTLIIVGFLAVQLSIFALALVKNRMKTFKSA